MPTPEYIYRVTEVVTIVDGDTYRLRISPGFHATLLITVRLYGYDTPEKHKGSPHERAAALDAQRAAGDFLLDDGELWVQTRKDPDDFGRWLGDIWDYNGAHLGEHLHAIGMASVWPTRWRDEYDVTP